MALSSDAKFSVANGCIVLNNFQLVAPNVIASSNIIAGCFNGYFFIQNCEDTHPFVFTHLITDAFNIPKEPIERPRYCSRNSDLPWTVSGLVKSNNTRDQTLIPLSTVEKTGRYIILGGRGKCALIKLEHNDARSILELKDVKKHIIEHFEYFFYGHK